MNCYQAKTGELAPHWYVIDATDQVVGRLAVQIATILMGKHRPTYTPHIDTGDFVIVTNVDKVVFTGNKWQQKFYQRYSGYPGGQKEEQAWKLFRRRPEQILELAVRRMLPKSKLGRHMLTKLKLVVGPTHPHQAQAPIPLEPLSGRPVPAGAVYRPPPKPKAPRTQTQTQTQTQTEDRPAPPTEGPPQTEPEPSPQVGTAQAQADVQEPVPAPAPEAAAPAPPAPPPAEEPAPGPAEPTTTPGAES